MAEIINIPLCESQQKNTGFCKCTINLKELVGSFIIPKGKHLTQTELLPENIGDTLATLILESPSKRLYPFSGFVAINDSSEDITSQSYGYGKKVKVRDGNNNWVAEYRNGGLGLSNAMRSFDQSQNKYDVLFIFKNTLVGTKKVVAGDIVMAGIPMDSLEAYVWKISDGSKETSYRFGFSFEPQYVNELVAAVEYNTGDIILKDLKGLQNINLSKIATTTSTVKVKVATDCGENLGELYAQELTTNTALWKVSNAATSASIPVTTVVYNSTDGIFTVTFDTSSTNCPAVGASINVTLDTPDTLNIAGIAGYEVIKAVSFVRP